MRLLRNVYIYRLSNKHQIYLCLIGIVLMFVFNVWLTVSTDIDRMMIRSDFQDTPPTYSDLSISSYDPGLDGQKLENGSDRMLHQVFRSAIVLANRDDKRPINNKADNLLIYETGIRQGGQPCHNCMGVDDSGREVFNQSRVNKTLLRKRTCHGCFKNNFGYVIRGSEICGSGDVFVVFLIASSHHNFLRRSVLRTTWLSFATKTSNIRYAFILGENPSTRLQRAIHAENEKHQDIVKFSFIDSYKNLTLKTIASYKWAVRYCPQAKFVMKTDDDVFVNIPSLLRMLTRPDVDGRAQRSIFGNCYTGIPNRYVISKYFTSYHEYIRHLYPPFCSGTGYVTSMRVVRKVSAISPNVPFFHLEDVYIGLCMELLRYDMVYVSGFRLKVLPRHYHTCVYTGRSAMTTHAHIPNNIFMIWKLRCDDNRF